VAYTPVFGVVMRVPVIEGDGFVVSLEIHRGNTFIHCDVSDKKYNRKMRSDLIAASDLLLGQRRSPLFALHELGDTKHTKFLTLMKFKFSQTILCLDGKERDIYIREVQ
jgi:hypothetical protein